MSNLYPPFHNRKTMVFVDGENLVVRYQEMLKAHKRINSTKHKTDIYVWSDRFYSMFRKGDNFIRTSYYTSTRGGDDVIKEAVGEMKGINIEQPYVFKRKEGKSKRVDITLATDMLIHASRHNCETVILISGDEDYVPLVEAVKTEGCYVILAALSSGLSPALKNSSDHFYQLDDVFYADVFNNF